MKLRLLGLFVALTFLYACDLGSGPTGGGTEGNGLKGILVDGRGTPIAGAKVRVYPDVLVLAKRSVALVATADSTTTKADGSFKFANLPDGRYNLEASITRNDTVFSLSIRSIDFVKKLNLGLDTLKVAGSVTLKILDSLSMPVVGVDCSIPGSSWKAVSNGAGECVIYGVAPGIYPVTVSVNGVTATRAEVTVVESQTTDGGSVNLLPSGDGVSIPANWKQVSAQGYVFSIPPEMQLESEGISLERWDASYATSTLLLYLGAGMGVQVEKPFDAPEYKFSILPVDSTIQKALVTYRTGDTISASNFDYPFRAGMQIEKPHDPLVEMGATYLVFEAHAETRRDQETAVRIFKSVKKWKGPGPAPVSAPVKPTVFSPRLKDTLYSAVNAEWMMNQGTTLLASYRLQVSMSPSFTTLVQDDSISLAGRVSWRDTLNLPLQVTPGSGLTYYWRVVAVGPGGSTASETRTLHMPLPRHVPSQPTMIYPPAGYPNVSLSPRLTWEVLADAPEYSYRIEVSKDGWFTSFVVRDSVFRPEIIDGKYSHVVGPLKPDSLYTWRVIAVTTSQPPLESPGSITGFFTTVLATTDTLPIVPQLQSPAEGALVISNYDSASFSWMTWNGGATTSYYHLQVATDSSFLDPVVNDSLLAQNRETGISTYKVGLQRGKDYYWRVVGVGRGGITASVIRKMTLSVPLPD